MGMTNEEREKHIRIANVLIGAINDSIRPILMYQIEKDVAREALENYVKMLEQQPCEDCISREQTLKAFAEKCGGECACCKYNGSGYDNAENCKLIKSMPSVTPQQTRWIPIKIRPMTEEEKEEIGHEYAFMYDCPLPDDGQDVLITDCFGNIEVDTFCRDNEGVYFENNCDDGDVIAWMPLPEPYNEESEDKE